jgi:signal transduction histidine kinase
MRTPQLSFLCHEIRNPLNAVLGYITFLEETRMTDEQEELVHTTAQCCLQLRRIVNDVLDLSSIEQVTTFSLSVSVSLHLALSLARSLALALSLSFALSFRVTLFFFDRASCSSKLRPSSRTTSSIRS